MIEYKTTASGLVAADVMLKTADVQLVEAETVCPGKYLAVIAGSISAVQAAVDAASQGSYAVHFLNSFVLGNPHEQLIPALTGATEVESLQALGTVEVYDAVTALVAADEAAKTAHVSLIEIRLCRGMCGKSFFTLTGEVAAVEAAVERAKLKAGEGGMLLDASVIARPDPKLAKAVL
jgi:microcompartment protein CcmL/EutN